MPKNLTAPWLVNIGIVSHRQVSFALASACLSVYFLPQRKLNIAPNRPSEMVCGVKIHVYGQLNSLFAG